MCQRASKQAYLIYRHNWYMALPVGSTKTENKQTSFMVSRSFHWAIHLRMSFSKGAQTASKITFQWLEIYCAACLQLLWSSVLALGSPHERMAAKLSIASALEFWARRRVCNLPAIPFHDLVLQCIVLWSNQWHGHDWLVSWEISSLAVLVWAAISLHRNLRNTNNVGGAYSWYQNFTSCRCNPIVTSWILDCSWLTRKSKKEGCKLYLYRPMVKDNFHHILRRYHFSRLSRIYSRNSIHTLDG